MEMVILIGVQGAGKSTFYRERFLDTHIRINLDMLRTRRREQLLIDACLAARQPFLIDNTNPTAESRAGYIAKARAAGFRVTGYFFPAKLSDALRRNAARAGKKAIPAPGVIGTYRKLQPPAPEEGFDELYAVTALEQGRFHVEPWLPDHGKGQ